MLYIELLFPAHERFLIGRDPHGISAIYLYIYSRHSVRCRVFTLCKTAYHILPFHISFLEKELYASSRRRAQLTSFTLITFKKNMNNLKRPPFP